MEKMAADDVDELLIEVRANTRSFASDVAEMRGSLDSSLVSGFRDAGAILERGLLGALRKGKFGFEDLKRVGLSVVDQIASRALQAGFDKLFGGGQQSSGVGGGIGGLLSGTLGGILGLPGRATGGPVSPGRGYLVGERGPEMFVPASAGRVETGGIGRGAPRDVRVAINLAPPRAARARQRHCAVPAAKWPARCAARSFDSGYSTWHLRFLASDADKIVTISSASIRGSGR